MGQGIEQSRLAGIGVANQRNTQHITPRTGLALNATLTFLPKFEGVKEISNFYQMLPYIVTMIVLIFTSKNSQAPKAEGIPYDKGSR